MLPQLKFESQKQMKNIYATLLAFMALSAVTHSHANVIFQDDFNAENAGAGALNYSAFSNWKVSGGTVDLNGKGFFDFYPLNGLFVDLDGSTSNPGNISARFAIPSGQYQLRFDLGGSTRGDTNQVVAIVGREQCFSAQNICVWTRIFEELFEKQSPDPLAPVTRTFNTSGAADGILVFENAGGDNSGAILDNVSLERIGPALVSEPPALPLIGTILLGQMLWRRRRL